jgi:hypothetical protein
MVLYDLESLSKTKVNSSKKFLIFRVDVRNFINIYQDIVTMGITGLDVDFIERKIILHKMFEDHNEHGKLEVGDLKCQNSGPVQKQTFPRVRSFNVCIGYSLPGLILSVFSSAATSAMRMVRIYTTPK